MTDIKISRSKRTAKRRGKPSYPRSLGYNEMMYKTSWTQSALAAGTTGTISASISPSIQNSTEYSTMQSIFTEVKLLKFIVNFTPTQSTNGIVNHSNTVVGTNMVMNLNVFTPPTAYLGVENSSNVVTFNTAAVRVLRYRAKVPPRGELDFANIVADAPNPVTPWAGSPGAVLVFAANLTSSTVYYQVNCYAWFHLRGRQ